MSPEEFRNLKNNILEHYSPETKRRMFEEWKEMPVKRLWNLIAKWQNVIEKNKSIMKEEQYLFYKEMEDALFRAAMIHSTLDNHLQRIVMLETELQFYKLQLAEADQRLRKYEVVESIYMDGSLEQYKKMFQTMIDGAREKLNQENGK